MPDYRASVQMPQMPVLNAGATGEQYGKYVGNIAGAISGVVVSDQTKKKIDEYVNAYNNPKDTMFGGLTGSQRSDKLARLLLPLNAELSAKYQAIAQKEKADETQISRNMEVVNARNAVSDTESDPNIDVEAINAEINLIINRLNELKQTDQTTPIEPQSMTPPVDTTPVIPQTGYGQPPPYAQRYQLPMSVQPSLGANTISNISR